MLINELKQLLSQEYGLGVSKIVPGPRQFVAETFIVSIKDAEEYFLKAIPQAEFPRGVNRSLSVIVALSETGLLNIPKVIPTIDKRLHVESEGFTYILFTYIPGQQTFSYDNRRFAEFIAKLHQTKIKMSIQREVFTSYVDRLFPQTFDSLMLHEHADLVANESKQVLLDYEKEIREDWGKFQQLINECQNLRTESFVITHGDAPGNVMINNSGDLYVVDWDNILLAPPERDVWFLAEKAEFMSAYQEKFPNFSLNKTYYSYYVMWRMFDDLFGWIGEILSNKTVEHKKTNFEDLKEGYFNWLRPLVRKL